MKKKGLLALGLSMLVTVGTSGCVKGEVDNGGFKGPKLSTEEKENLYGILKAEGEKLLAYDGAWSGVAEFKLTGSETEEEGMVINHSETGTSRITVDPANKKMAETYSSTDIETDANGKIIGNERRTDKYKEFTQDGKYYSYEYDKRTDWIDSDYSWENAYYYEHCEPYAVQSFQEMSLGYGASLTLSSWFAADTFGEMEEAWKSFTEDTLAANAQYPGSKFWITLDLYMEEEVPVFSVASEWRMQQGDEYMETKGATAIKFTEDAVIFVTDASHKVSFVDEGDKYVETFREQSTVTYSKGFNETLYNSVNVTLPAEDEIGYDNDLDITVVIGGVELEEHLYSFGSAAQAKNCIEYAKYVDAWYTDAEYTNVFDFETATLEELYAVDKLYVQSVTLPEDKALILERAEVEYDLSDGRKMILECLYEGQLQEAMIDYRSDVVSVYEDASQNVFDERDTWWISQCDNVYVNGQEVSQDTFGFTYEGGQMYVIEYNTSVSDKEANFYLMMEDFY